MAPHKPKEKKQPSAKDSLTTRITELLKPLQGTLKKGLGEKKLEKRIKKAAKFLLHGIKTGDPKKTAKKLPVKKAVKPKSSTAKAKKTTLPEKATS